MVPPGGGTVAIAERKRGCGIMMLLFVVIVCGGDLAYARYIYLDDIINNADRREAVG